MKDREHFLEPEIRDGVPVSAELKAVWKKLLDLLEIFIRVCDKYDLNYALDGGSLLGAMRHRGFIPWDDDLDVEMPRKDYDRLIEVLPRELPSDVVMRTFATEPESWLAHLCLMDVNSTSIDTLYTEWKLRIAMGIRIDVVPIDGVPTDKKTQDKMMRKSRFINGIIRNRYACGKSSLSGRIKHWAGALMLSLIGKKRLFKWRENIFRKVDFEGVGLGATMPANHSFAEHSWRKAEWFSSYREVPFEYLTVKVPVGAEHQLDQLYGKDWRTPKRHAGFHNDMLVDANRKYKDVLVERFGYKESCLSKLP